MNNALGCKVVQKKNRNETHDVKEDVARYDQGFLCDPNRKLYRGNRSNRCGPV
jgi:hypothetical protein